MPFTSRTELYEGRVAPATQPADSGKPRDQRSVSEPEPGGAGNELAASAPPVDYPAHVPESPAS